MKIYLFFLIPVVLVSFQRDARAQLIASESFNYTTGNITGQNGGTGWSGGWLKTSFNASNNTVATPGLTMPPQVAGTGNQNHQNGSDYRNFRFLDTTSTLALSLMDTKGDPGAGLGKNYQWGSGYGKDGTSIWISFLFYRSNSTSGYGGMHLMYGMDLSFDQYGDKKSHQRFQFGADNSHTHYMLSRTINQNSNLPTSCGLTIAGNTTVNGTLHLLVQRIDFKPGPENAFMWIDPISCQAPDTGLADVKMYGICDFRFNAINIGSGGGANFEMDELRLGVTFPDVVNCTTTGLNEFEPHLQQKFAYPNPSDGDLKINFNAEEATNGRIRIYNLLGEMVSAHELRFEKGVNAIPISAEAIDNGTYFIQLNISDQIYSTQKLIMAR